MLKSKSAKNIESKNEKIEKEDLVKLKHELKEMYIKRNSKTHSCAARVWPSKDLAKEFGNYGFPCGQTGKYNVDGIYVCGTHYNKKDGSLKVDEHGLMKDSIQTIKKANKMNLYIDKEIEIDNKLIPLDKEGNPIIEL